MKKFFAASLAAAALFCAALPLGAEIKSASAYRLVNGEKVYSVVTDKIIYQTEKPFDKTINTFEAWIKLPAELSDDIRGGIIFGNYYNTPTGYPGCVNFGVGKGGLFELYWNQGEYKHTFGEVDLRTGEWTHVALVRDKAESTLTYYVNGEEKTKLDQSLSESVSDMIFAVGNDWNNWYVWYEDNLDRVPFYGQIRQITLYSEAVSQDIIKADMQSARITGADRPVNGLMANWNFTEEWGVEQVIEDDSSTKNNCVRGTYDCYVPEEAFEDFDYSFVVIPDMQAMNYWKPDNFLQQSEWIVNNAEKEKIKFAMYLGDMIEDRYDSGYSNSNPERAVQEWLVAQQCITMLDGVVPYTVILGNHDYDNWAVASRKAEQFNKFFPYEKYSKLSYFGGAYEEGDMSNTYSLFQAGDVEYLVFALEYGPRQRVLNWVNRIIDEHPESRVIITTHSLVEPNGQFVSATGNFSPSKTIGSYDSVNCGQEMWDKVLSKHNNIFMNFSGHLCTDYVVMREDTGDAGNTVRSVLINAQGSIMTCAMNTILIVRVNERTKQMNFSYYSPEYDMVFNEQGQFTISFEDDHNPTVGTADQSIESVVSSALASSSEENESSGSNVTGAQIAAVGATGAALVLGGLGIGLAVGRKKR